MGVPLSIARVGGEALLLTAQFIPFMRFILAGAGSRSIESAFIVFVASTLTSSFSWKLPLPDRKRLACVPLRNRNISPPCHDRSCPSRSCRSMIHCIVLGEARQVVSRLLLERDGQPDRGVQVANLELRSLLKEAALGTIISLATQRGEHLVVQHGLRPPVCPANGSQERPCALKVTVAGLLLSGGLGATLKTIAPLRCTEDMIGIITPTYTHLASGSSTLQRHPYQLINVWWRVNVLRFHRSAVFNSPISYLHQQR